MNCKKCGKTAIEDEAYNAFGGGFLCKPCYRRFQWTCGCAGLACAAVGLLVGIIVVAALVLGRTAPGS